jgi:hypothetical protein
MDRVKTTAAAAIGSETSNNVRPAVSIILLAVASLVLLLSLIRIVVFWSNQAYLHPQAGVWTALAWDLANGTFYRSLDGPLGYGGTRYFPLPFVLHAGLIRITGEAIWSGFILSFVSVTLLVSGIYVLLRRVDVPTVLAAAAAVFVLASQITQDELLSIRGDSLAAALGVWGAVVCLPLSTSIPRIVTAAALFSLAFASKSTALAPAAALFFAFAIDRRWRAALLLSAATAAGLALILLLMFVCSDGRAFEALRAGGGSTTLRDLIMGPFTLARLARQEPETLVFIALGFAALLSVNIERWKAPDFPSLLLLATTAVTAVVFSFEGTDTNHLIDLLVAAVIMTAVAAGRELRQQGGGFTFAVAALVAASLAASMSLVSGVINRRTEQVWGRLNDALSKVEDASRPILAENPIVSVARGEQPYVLDPYMFRIMRDVNPQFGTPLWDKLRRQEFAAVILDRDPHTDRGREWYRAFFGEGFVEEMERHYVETARVRSRVIYVPR